MADQTQETHQRRRLGRAAAQLRRAGTDVVQVAIDYMRSKLSDKQRNSPQAQAGEKRLREEEAATLQVATGGARTQSYPT